MFTLEQINDLHARLGKAETLIEYVRALNASGVEKYDSYLTDGHSASSLSERSLPTSFMVLGEGKTRL